MEIQYYINNKLSKIKVDNSNLFKYGESICLSRKETDPTYSQEWYSDGYSIQPFFSINDFNFLKKNISKSIQNIINQELAINTDDFTLEKYHFYVKTDEDHLKITNKTRDLFEKDFDFPIREIIPKLSKMMSLSLTDENPLTKERIHIIVRINRPFSKDFNPPHKDVYEIVDEYSICPPLINFWIPIAGVTEKSSLPVVPRSHLLKESEILRSFQGAIVENQNYRVRIAKSWGNNNKLIRPFLNNGDILIFSSYLIHGLAVNENEDITRVALEFRLLNDDVKMI